MSFQTRGSLPLRCFPSSVSQGCSPPVGFFWRPWFKNLWVAVFLADLPLLHAPLVIRSRLWPPPSHLLWNKVFFSLSPGIAEPVRPPPFCTCWIAAAYFHLHISQLKPYSNILVFSLTVTRFFLCAVVDSFMLLTEFRFYPVPLV